MNMLHVISAFAYIQHELVKCLDGGPADVTRPYMDSPRLFTLRDINSLNWLYLCWTLCHLIYVNSINVIKRCVGNVLDGFLYCLTLVFSLLGRVKLGPIVISCIVDILVLKIKIYVLRKKMLSSSFIIVGC